MIKSKTLFLLLASAGVVAVPAISLAQEAANPLLRPKALSSRGQAQGLPQGMATKSPTASGNLNLPPPPGGIESPAVAGAPRGVSGLQTSLGRYAVVAVSGDTAILRMIPGTLATVAPDVAAGGVAGAASAAFPGGAAGAGAAAPGAPGAQQMNSQVLPSLVVRNNQKLMLNDISLLAEVKDNHVTLRMADASRVVFHGRLESMSQRVQKGVRMEAADMPYVQRNYTSPGMPGSTGANGAITGGAAAGAGAAAPAR